MLLQFARMNLRFAVHPVGHSRERRLPSPPGPRPKAAPAKLDDVQPKFRLLLLLAWAIPCVGQPASGVNEGLTPAQGQALVETALSNELRAAQDRSHLMRYRLRKTSPRLTTTKDICETKDGDVARLISMNDQPLSAAGEQKELARLQELLGDPGKQRRRKQAEDADAGRALNVLRALPTAFDYKYAGSAEAPEGKVERFTFRPRHGFSPPDLETQVLTAMAGEIWIDPLHQRVARLEGSLQQGVDFGWGMLGHLNRGGWIVIEQAEVAQGQWRIVHFQMAMEEETDFKPLPAGLDYRTAIHMLLAGP